MKTTVKRVASSLLMIPALALAFSFIAPTVGAVVSPGGISNGATAAKTDDQQNDLFGGTNSVFSQVSNALIFLIGAVAVIMLIYGGFRYVTSGGDEKSVTAAKNTILYAVVGIVVALLGYAAVNWVASTFKNGS